MARGKSQRSLQLIDTSAEILEAIHPTTVRGVAYQLFIRKLIPSMGANHVRMVGQQLGAARESGRIPWEWIVDPTREVEMPPTWDDPTAFANYVLGVYGKNKWVQQPCSFLVMSEKSTVAGILQPVIRRYEVPFLSVHGWNSKTRMREIAKQSADCAQPLVILYVGDRDCSGMRMSEDDLPTRLTKYREDYCQQTATLRGPMPEIIRVAVLQQDVRGRERFPAADKNKDPNYPWYVKRYGHWCYEVDALDPRLLRQRVEDAILSRLDTETWNRFVKVEQVERESLIETMDAWQASKCGGTR